MPDFLDKIDARDLAKYAEARDALQNKAELTRLRAAIEEKAARFERNGRVGINPTANATYQYCADELRAILKGE